VSIKKTFRTTVQYIPVFLLLFMLVYAGCQKKQPDETETSYPAKQELFDQSYGPNSLQRFDLFLPQGRNENTGTVIVIHGGGWVSGDKTWVNYYARQFSDSGYAAVSMNYRLANDSVHYQDMMDDIGSMIGCIAKKSGQWGIGNGRVALFGYSAGGHLALLYSYSRNMSQKIGAVISLAGPTDLQDSLLWESPGLFEEIGLMAGNTSPATWTPASPVNFITAANPPTLLIHGTNDTVVPVVQSIKLKTMLEASQIPVNLIMLENETHFYSSQAIRDLLDESRRFLDANLK
jgi:acetyl esterase/lipase